MPSMLTIALGVALGIVLAVLVLRYWRQIMDLGFVLLALVLIFGVLGAVLYIPVTNAISTYMKVTSEEPSAAYVYWFFVVFFGGIVALIAFWNRDKK